MLIPIGDDQIKGGHYPTFSYGFILLNIAVFVYEYLIFPDSIYHITITYGAIPAEIVQGRIFTRPSPACFYTEGPCT
jgi:membrane associated rhomboid family serine protease